jgi:glucose/mannose transport system permease protein
MDKAVSKRPSKFFHHLHAKIAAIPMILTAMVIFVGCSAWTVYYSFTNSKLLPDSTFAGLVQYERLFTTDRWYLAMENIIIFGILSMLFSLIVGFLLAAFLDQKIRFENTFRTIFLYPFAMSFIVTGLVWQWMLNPELGLEKVVRGWGFESFRFDWLVQRDTAIYTILIAALWQGTGLIMALMLAGLRSIDNEIWKSARVDGIPIWKTYLFIVIPMMRPIFVTTFLIMSMGIVRTYDIVVAQTSGGPGNATDVPAKYVYDMMFLFNNIGQGLAGSTIMLAAVSCVLIPWAIMEFRKKQYN